jgi:hypothetical protein
MAEGRAPNWRASPCTQGSLNKKLAGRAGCALSGRGSPPAPPGFATCAFAPGFKPKGVKHPAGRTKENGLSGVQAPAHGVCLGGGAPPGLRKGVGEGTWTRKDGLDVTHRGFRPRGRRPPAPGRGPLRCRRLEPGAGTAARSCKHGYSVRAGDAGKAIRGLRGLGTGHARACAGPPARLMGGLRGAPLTSPWARGPPRATSPCQWPGT